MWDLQIFEVSDDLMQKQWTRFQRITRQLHASTLEKPYTDVRSASHVVRIFYLTPLDYMKILIHGILEDWPLQYYNFCLKNGTFLLNFILSILFYPALAYYSSCHLFSKFLSRKSVLLSVCLFTSILWWATVEKKKKRNKSHPALFSHLGSAWNHMNLQGPSLT